MQHYGSANMGYDESGYFGCPGAEAFGMDTVVIGNVDTGNSSSVDLLQGPAGSTTFSGNLDRLLVSAAANFPGLGDQLSGGIHDSGLLVDSMNLAAGAFTNELNSISSVNFEVGSDDHSLLLQEMLQQQQQQSQPQSQISQVSHEGEQVVASAWEDSLHVLQEMLLLQQQQQAQQLYHSQAAEQVIFNHATATATPQTLDRAASGGGNYPGESELLSLLQLPRTAFSGLQPNSSGSGYASNSRALKSSSMYNNAGPPTGCISSAAPLNTGDHFYETRRSLHGLPLNSQQQGGVHTASPQSSTSFFHGLPRPVTDTLQAGSASNNSVQVLTRQAAGAQLLVDLEQEKLDEEGKLAASPFGSKRDGSSTAAGLAKGSSDQVRGVNHFATERQRREFLNEKYQTLRSLVPNPSKADRASIVADAIDYVKELKRTVQELQLLVQEKRRARGLGGGHHGAGVRGLDCKRRRIMKSATDQAAKLGNVDSFSVDAGTHLRSSWLQRTSHNGTHVDVRIVHDEVTIKISQRRRRNCLMDVIVALQELRLDLLQASGANIGEHDVFFFNTKIIEGSSTFAGYIAAKLVDAVDRRP
ncbi:unnamed protein product [Sphagnum balticum]